MRKRKDSLSFDAYYAGIFGDRWRLLKESLISSNASVPFCEGLLKPYYMDYASVVVALSMPFIESGMCLDMCAAPGGKTLVLASILGNEVCFQANEISNNRRFRLYRVIEEHLNDDVKKRISITGYDGASMARFCRDKYDRILLDAPCSSERHVILSSSALKLWSPARVKTLSMRQWALASSAFLMLKPGGFLVYSTCALLDNENDCIVDKLLAKYEDAYVVEYEMQEQLILNNSSKNISVTSIFNSFKESGFHKELCIKTKYGTAYLPDIHNGAGPMYFCIIGKKKLY